MTTCHECLRALQFVVHKVYEKGCAGCEVRELAYAALEDRERFYEKAEAHGGPACRREIKRLVDQERARIATLAEAMPKERV